MKPWVRYFLVGLVAFLLGAAAGGSEDNGGTVAQTETVTETQAAGAPEEQSSAEEPKRADISSDLTCDYNIDTTAADVGGSFIAGGTVRNDGDGAGRVTVAARWTLLGSSPARASKTVRVAPGREREVQMKVVATIDQISAYQSGNTKCRVSAR